MIDLDEFTRGYIDAALWTGTDEDERPLDELFSAADVTGDTLAAVR
jgi:hypothetical protein